MTSKLLSMLRLVGRHLGPSIFAALTALATTVGMCGVVNAMGSQSQLTYQLSGSAPVADYISYQTDSGQSGQTQQAHVPLPWTTQFSFNGSRVFVISAQSLGSITCTILIDGKVVSEASANGAPARTVCTN
ncbi:MAG TPA: MmpS family transport accessory protein [Mycobacterium sp.]|nr:MmpS family transport accessory protein [Mycobacterium sp.]